MKTFWLEPTGEVAVGLRRYSRSAGTTGFTCDTGYHSALTYTHLAPAILTDRGTLDLRDPTPHDDPRWPTQCQHGCGYEFTPDDEWQDWQERVYARADDPAQRFVLHSNAPATELGIPSAPPGATWDAHWAPWKGPDGVSLVVRCPDGADWMVDSRASNCGRPDDDDVHRCWVRHGDPRGAGVTVDKDGDTCVAGGGSIQTPGWHGFLRRGELVPA